MSEAAHVDVLIERARVLTMDAAGTELEDASIAISDGRILEIGPAAALAVRYCAGRAIDAGNMLAMPGLINAHNHLFQVMCRGLGDERDLSDWAARAIWPVAPHLGEDECEIGATLACVEMLESGTTTVIDSHYLHAVPTAGEGCARACLASGIRAILGRAAMDCGSVPEAFLETPGQAVKATEALIQKYDGREGRLMVRPEAMSEAAASKEMILQLRALSREAGTGFHMHAAESQSRPEQLRLATGFRTIQYLDHLRVLGPDVLLAHCVWVDDEERSLLAGSGTKVAHNPLSNQFLADGVAPIPAFLADGIPVGLGTDGAGSNNSLDMFEVMKAAALLQKIRHLDARALTALQALAMATIGGARAAGIDGITGSLEPGKRADIVLLALDEPRMVPRYSTISNLVYSSPGRLVRTVMVEGAVVVEDGRCVSVDRRRVIEEASKLERRLKEQRNPSPLTDRYTAC